MIRKNEAYIECPTVHVPMVLCPWCGDDAYDVRTSKYLADGSRAQYCACRGCEQRFRVLHQPPVPIEKLRFFKLPAGTVAETRRCDGDRAAELR